MDIRPEELKLSSDIEWMAGASYIGDKALEHLKGMKVGDGIVTELRAELQTDIDEMHAKMIEAEAFISKMMPKAWEELGGEPDGDQD